MDMPDYPDPKKTASAQGDMNVATAVANQFLNMTDQKTPDGRLTYDQVGTTVWRGPDGKTYRIPRFQATTSLSRDGRMLLNRQNDAKIALAGLMRDQSERLGGLLGRPINLDNNAIEGHLFGLGRKRLDPKFAADEESLRTRLANQGLQPGSAAWEAEMAKFGQNRNDAYNQLLLQGRGQAVQELLTKRNQPLNEIIGLMSGTQVNQPQFQNTPGSNIANVDYASLVDRKYQADAAAAQSKMGGLFGLLGAGVSLFSDRRLKAAIERVGTLASGLGLYVFDYIGGARGVVGVMADEVAALMPEAVEIDASGFARVHYDIVGA